ncbi:aliphatic nitrilase [Paraphaeosphaeria minitans]|uniref:nitrilase n=1 Tax=Paraphaeosphaeria minitans TaxID=565426 RepID=A0A9P6G841_9PLEO|nr:aliphatic nitrilase [Paraphaeosphaeria minitans]
MSSRILRVAVTQAEPEWFDLQGTVDKTICLMEEAASNGAKLITFPEVWIPGYPGWIWYIDRARLVDPALGARYIQNSMSATGPEMQMIQKAAKQHNIAVVLGFSERTPSNSLYISQNIISPGGDILLKRRKIKPTHMERTIYGDGSGSDLTNVVAVDFGGIVGTVKIGTLACWEHTQPLLKYNTYAQDEVVHVAMWPPLHAFGAQPAPENPGLFSMSHDGAYALSTTHAIEGGTFVLYTTAVCTEKGIDTFDSKQGLIFREPGGGQAAVIGPDGRRLTTELEGGPTKEGILYADLELDKGLGVKAFMDVVGHYARPDLLWLGVDRQEKKYVVERPRE